jgi:D-tyrosyl-tRNA(Tyr) deacylase
MRALIQRVTQARVIVEEEGQKIITGQIQQGLVTFLGFHSNDTVETVEKMIQKIIKLRIFEDSQHKMNESLLDQKKDHLLVSQFTLYGDCSQGNRPSFKNASSPEHAKKLYEYAIEYSRQLGIKTEVGKFQADMKVELVNDGPVTLYLELP